MTVQAHNKVPSGENRQLPVGHNFNEGRVLENWFEAMKPQAVLAFIASLLPGDRVAIDLETTGFDPFVNKLTVFGISKDGQEVMVFGSAVLADEEVKMAIKGLLADPTISKVFHNAQFDMKWLFVKFGASFANCDCTMIMRQLLVCGLEDRGQPVKANLKICASDYLDYEMNKEIRDEFIGTEIISDEMLAYCAIDVAATWHLEPILKAYLVIEEMNLCYDNIEKPCIPVVMECVATGIGIDKEYAKKLEQGLVSKIDRFQLNLDAHCLHLKVMPKKKRKLLQREKTHEQIINGYTHVMEYVPGLNVNSSKQVTELLNNLGFAVTSSGKEVMEELPVNEESFAFARRKMPGHTDEQITEFAYNIVNMVLDLRGARRALEGFVIPLQTDHIHPVTGKIHTDLRQIGTKTGRFASSDPNLQNMPAKEKSEIFDGLSFRNIFMPPAGFEFIVYDYSACELRILAQITGDKNLMEAVRIADETGVKLHKVNASFMFDKPIEEITDFEYKCAKIGMFLLIYGGGAKKLARSIKRSINIAKNIISTIEKQFPEMTRWRRFRAAFAVREGYSVSMSGRRRYYSMPEIGEVPFGMMKAIKASIERKAVNMPIQSTNADVIKLAMVEVDRVIKPHGGKILLCVHDELIGIAPIGEQAELCYKLMGEAMLYAESEFLIDVKPAVEGSRGRSWEH